MLFVIYRHGKRFLILDSLRIYNYKHVKDIYDLHVLGIYEIGPLLITRGDTQAVALYAAELSGKSTRNLHPKVRMRPSSVTFLNKKGVVVKAIGLTHYIGGSAVPLKKTPAIDINITSVTTNIGTQSVWRSTNGLPPPSREYK